MSTAVATVNFTNQQNAWTAGNKYFVAGTVSISASSATYVTGGIPMSFFLPLIKATFPPLAVQVWGSGLGVGGTLFHYIYIPGADASAGLLKIFAQGAGAGDGMAELSEEDIPADVSGDTINFLAIFNGML